MDVQLNILIIPQEIINVCTHECAVKIGCVQSFNKEGRFQSGFDQGLPEETKRLAAPIDPALHGVM